MMKLDLNSMLDEMLSIEREEIKTPTLRERFVNFKRRAEIERALKDEHEANEKLIVELGSLSEHFLQSRFYGELIEPFIKSSVKGSLQRIIREGETLTESQLKSEIAGIKKMLSLVGSLKLKIRQAEDVRKVK